MNSNSEKDTLMVEKVDRAIRQAAEKVLERAKQTSTPVVIWEDEQIREVPPEEAELRITVKPSLETGA
ncbi:MAG: hypothetical protein ISS61_02135 [Desulfobacteraceae bacterium]|nr:hypothetical protein [Desulfobacteraceae bacterium]